MNYINNKIEDPNRARRLGYIWRHAGESVDAKRHNRSRVKWRSVWADSEADFVAS